MPGAVVFDELGGPDVLHVVEEPVVEPAAGEVRVRIEAFAVNPLDAMMRSGTSPVPVPLPHARLGVEGTGVIDAVGPGVSAWEIGDPVILTAVPDATVRGSYAEYTTAPANRVIARPAGLTVPEAAAVWVAYSTAYGGLVEKAGMRPGDRVLVTAASGGVGRAAMQIANQIGAVPLALTRHTAKTGELLAAGAAAVIATDRMDVADAVRQYTGGDGADIVLDLVGGPGQPELLRAARPDATLVVAGFLDPRPTPSPVPSPLTIFRYRSFEHTLDDVVVRRMAAFLNAGVRLGALRPAIDRVFALDEVVEAHRHLEKGLHTGGKIVVTIQEPTSTSQPGRMQGRIWPGGNVPPPPDPEGAQSGHICLTWNVTTPLRFKQITVGGPTVRKAEFRSGRRMVREANTGSRKAGPIRVRVILSTGRVGPDPLP